MARGSNNRHYIEYMYVIAIKFYTTKRIIATKDKTHKALTFNNT